MALQVTVPGDKNPIGTDPIAVHVRTGAVSADAVSQYLIGNFNGWTDKASYDAGKNPIAQFLPLNFTENPVPDSYHPETGELMQKGRPSYAQIYGTFQAEFDYMSALMYELAKRYDPAFENAIDVEPLPDPAVVADINNRLDQAGL